MVFGADAGAGAVGYGVMCHGLMYVCECEGDRVVFGEHSHTIHCHLNRNFSPFMQSNESEFWQSIVAVFLSLSLSDLDIRFILSICLNGKSIFSRLISPAQTFSFSLLLLSHAENNILYKYSRSANEVHAELQVGWGRKLTHKLLN